MTLIITLLLFCIGFMSSYLMINKLSLAERLAISPGLGILIFSIGPFIQVVKGYPLNKMSLSLYIVTILLLLALFNFKNKSITSDIKKLNITSLSWLFKDWKKYLTLFLLFWIVITFVTVLRFPITDWDALTLYDFRGKVLSQNRTFNDLQKLDGYDNYNPGYYFSYPPSTSLVHAVYYVLGAKSPQIIYPVLFFSLVLFFYTALCKYVSRTEAFFMSFILMLSSSLMVHATLPYTNLPYTYCYFISSALLINYIIKKDNTGLLVLSAIFLAGSTWMRSVEPFFMVNLCVMLFLVLKSKLSLITSILYLIPIFSLKKTWSWVQVRYSTTTFLSNIDLKTLTVNLLNISIQSIKTPFMVFISFLYQNGLIFLIFLVSILIIVFKKNKKLLSPESLYTIIITADLLIIFAGTMVIGILIPGRVEIYSSINRFGIFLIPLILFLSSLVFKNIIPQKYIND